MSFWMIVAGAVGITAVVALLDRWLGRGDNEVPPDPVHYGHTNVDDHEYDDLPPHRAPNL